MEYIIKINNIFKSVHFICWLCLVSIVLFYNYLYSFSFLPITEGWFTVFAKLMNNGLVPYNDFYLYLTPLYPLIIANFILLSEEALRIKKFQPDVIINLLLPENAWSAHERLFRNNNRLGQRDIYDAINDLTLNKSIYRLAMNEELSNNLFLQIWTKK